MKENTQKIAVSRGGVGDAAVALDQVKAKGVAGASRRADAMAFLRAFLARPFEVASVVPSSVHLEERVVRAASLQGVRCVLELGPGTGGTTRALLRRLPHHARLLALELNPDFCDRLSCLIDDPRFAVHQGCAEELGGELQRRGMPAPDVIVSGIPFSTLPPEVAQRIAAAIASNLAPGGRFVAYQWRPRVADFMRPHLGTERFMEWEWRCLPPMRVFVWDKPAEGIAGRGSDAAQTIAQAALPTRTPGSSSRAG